MGNYKVSIDKELCIGCGACITISDENFALKNGKAITMKKEIDKKDYKQIKEICPVNAIKVK
jgi:ferredoxin